MSYLQSSHVDYVHRHHKTTNSACLLTTDTTAYKPLPRPAKTLQSGGLYYPQQPRQFVQNKYNSQASLFRKQPNYSPERAGNLSDMMSTKRIKTMYDEPDERPYSQYCRECTMLTKMNKQLNQELDKKESHLMQLLAAVQEIKREKDILRTKLKMSEEESNKLSSRLRTKQLEYSCLAQQKYRQYNLSTPPRKQKAEQTHSSSAKAVSKQYSIRLAGSADTADSTNTKNQINNLRKRLQTLESSYIEQINDKDQQIKKLAQNLDIKQTINKVAKAELAKTQAELSLAQTQLKEVRDRYESEIQEYKTALQQVIVDITRADDSMRKLDDEHRKVKQEVADAYYTISEWEQKHKQLQQQKEAVQSEVAYLERLNETLKDALKAQQQTQTCQIAQLHLQKQNNLRELEYLKQQVSRLNQQLAASKQIIVQPIPSPNKKADPNNTSTNDSMIDDLLTKECRIAQLETENAQVKNLLWKYQSSEGYTGLKQQVLQLQGQNQILLERNYTKDILISHLQKMLAVEQTS